MINGWAPRPFAREAIELISVAMKETHASACLLTFVDRKADLQGEVSTSGYVPDVAAALSSRAFMKSRGFRLQQTQADTPLRWQDTPGFPSGRLAQAILIPAGYQNGISLPLRRADEGTVGILHLNTPTVEFPVTATNFLRSIAPLFRNVAISAGAFTSYRLTRREEAVLAHVSHGLTNAEVGAQLGIARGTVATHVENILAKLQVPNRVRAAAIGSVAFGLTPLN